MCNYKKFEDKWKLKHIVFNDGPCGICVALFEDEDGAIRMGMRWLPNRKTKDKEGNEVECTSLQGDETDWIIIPSDFAGVIGKELIGKKVAGFPNINNEGFNEEGFKFMVDWLLECEVIFDGICY